MQKIRHLFIYLAGSFGTLALILPLPPGRAAASDGVPFGPESVITNNADSARSVYAADMDGDGDLDVLSASWGDDKIAWYENDGGSPPDFTDHVITIDAEHAESVHAADVDGDGDLWVAFQAGRDAVAAHGL